MCIHGARADVLHFGRPFFLDSHTDNYAWALNRRLVDTYRYGVTRMLVAVGYIANTALVLLHVHVRRPPFSSSLDIHPLLILPCRSTSSPPHPPLTSIPSSSSLAAPPPPHPPLPLRLLPSSSSLGRRLRAQVRRLEPRALDFDDLFWGSLRDVRAARHNAAFHSFHSFHSAPA